MQPMTIISFDEACGRSAIGDLGFVPKEYRGTVGEKLISAWTYGSPDSSSQRRRAMRPTFPSFAAGTKRRVPVDHPSHHYRRIAGRPSAAHFASTSLWRRPAFVPVRGGGRYEKN